MIYMFLSNKPLSGDINSSNLPCFIRISGVTKKLDIEIIISLRLNVKA